VDYIEIAASVPALDAERACDVLRAATGVDAWFDVPFVQPDLESDAIPTTSGSACVRAYVARADAARAIAAAERALADAGLPAAVTQRPVAEEDWAEAWKEYFHVERFGEHIVVVPSWREYDPKPGDVTLHLDPGMAFGTGQHETTRMCLEALEQHVKRGARVLDVGCGSGILSIAALKLGASAVCAVDVDPNCVRVTDANAAANGVTASLSAAVGSLAGAWPFAEPSAGRFDVVVANIIARIIIEHAASLVAALVPGGVLVTSGIIGERETEVVDALTAAGARVTSVRAMGDWRCIEAVRA
jgi:ribosomal protein L11 methyltransferase